MEDPVEEIKHVVRSLTESKKASTITKNVETYFTEDAYIEYPVFNQRPKPDGRKDLIGIYSMLRVISSDNRIEFHSVMFNEDKTKCFIDLTEHMALKRTPIERYWPTQKEVRFLVLVDFRKCSDGKYRISRQQDHFPTDLTLSGQLRGYPILEHLNTSIKFTIGSLIAWIGNFLLSKGWIDS